jgi:electron transfer flavoprotein beta subunit
MNIIVCIKQVPETTEVKIDPQTNTLIREGVNSIINPFDMYALEEGIRLKERFGAKTTVLTMGPPQAESALREALAMGIDEAILLTDRAFAGSDTLVTSYILSCAIKKIGDFALILCGKQASDGDTAQVGPGISAHLDIPQVTYVRKIKEVKQGQAIVERMTEEGFEVIQTPLPSLFTVVKEINEPRLPSLRGKMRARRAVIPGWTHKDLGLLPEKIGLSGSPTQVVKIFTPPARPRGQIFHNQPDEAVERLVEALKSEIN